MKGGNKYYRRSRTSEERFRELVRYFALDFSATAAARLTCLTRKSATIIFIKIRQRLAQDCKRKSPLRTGQIALDESHSCTLCICGKRRCGFTSRTPVFSLLKYEDSIYTEIVPDCKKAPLRAMIRGRPVASDVLYVDGWHGYHALVDADHEKPFVIMRAHGDTSELPHMPDIESFWSFARRRLEKFNGVSNRTFYLHLKECEWRFNMHQRDLYTELLTLLTNHPL